MLIGAAAAFTGCKEDETEKLKSPTVTVTEDAVTGTDVKFTITTTDADECAYIFDTAENLGGGIPDAATVLAEGEKVDTHLAATVVKEITPATEYIVYAAAKNAAGFSEVAKCELNVPNLVEVEVSNITKSSYTFTITTDGERAYKYTAIPTQYLEQIYQAQEAATDYEKSRAAMRYLAWYGTKDSGTKEFTHNDNENFTEIEDGDAVEYLRELIAGMDYSIVAVGYGANNQFAGNVIVKNFTLAESGTPTGKVKCELVGEAGIISAKTKCTPDENVLWYKHILIKKENRDAYVAERGLTQYHYLVANTDSSEHLTGEDESQYKNLNADTEYVLSLVIVDKEHNADWQDFEFKTKKADEQSADIVITGHTSDAEYIYGDPWNALTFNIKSSEIVLPSKYFFGYTSLVTYLMNRGLTLEEVIDQYGESFSQYNLYGINGANGYNAEFYELKPDVAYTYAVALTNANGKVNVKSMELRTEKRTVANLSSSSLFEDLKGEWAAVVPVQEYKWETGEYQNYEYKFDVTIGNDGEFGDLCRSYNWLMCKGWAGLEYKSADDLRNDPANDGYYKEVPENLFYNFGPKWFLEIDADGNVTVPTNSSYVPYLMNYEENAPAARLAAVGSYVSSDPLPVEISSDKNTITIKPYMGYSGPEYLMLIDDGAYMAPSAKTSGDIVLTRK